MSGLNQSAGSLLDDCTKSVDKSQNPLVRREGWQTLGNILLVGHPLIVTEMPVTPGLFFCDFLASHDLHHRP